MIDGLVSAAGLDQLAQALVGDLAGQPPQFGLCDYRAANVKVAPRLMYAAVRRTGARLYWPTALLVRADQVPLLRAYASLQCGAGMLRAVFTDEGRAVKWATENAALYEAQRRHFARRCR